jgi:hypothetical protein
MSKKLLEESKGIFFDPSQYRNLSRPASRYLNKRVNTGKSIEDFKESELSIETENSFRYKNKNHLVSTQELNLDYSKFENHTFFHSAVAKTNEAFSKLINEYPYDGSLKEIESFEDSLTGYAKYILDIFPKNKGYLVFSGSSKQEGSAGTHIEIKDGAGRNIPSLNTSTTTLGKNILNPNKNDFTVQFFIKPAEIVNDNQVVFQKRSALANNMTICLSASSQNSASIIFGITSQSYDLTVSSSFDKSIFNHISAIYDSKTGETKLIIFPSGSNTETIVSSSNRTIFDKLNFEGSSIIIGSGSWCRINQSIFKPQETYSGSIDELKYYHKEVSLEDIKKNKEKTDYAKTDLKLYYKFNEPYGDFKGNNIILDSSGNSLNSEIKNFDYLVNRNTGSLTPMVNEDLDRSPVLFPKYENVNSLYTKLITTGTLYDDFNPNLITKLIPPHYLHEGNIAENFTTEYSNISKSYTNLESVRKGKDTESTTQTLMKFLFIWAKHFDEIKMFVDNFSNLNNVNYDDLDTVPDIFLKSLAKKLGINLPDLFNYANLDQYIHGENLYEDSIRSTLTLNEIQNKIWRRILTDHHNIIKTKGTIDSIKSVFRYAGIEPDNIFDIKEYGGARLLSIDDSKKIKKNSIRFLTFSGSIGHTNETTNAQGRSMTSPIVVSQFLSASRVEIGAPEIQGTFVNKNLFPPHGISNNSSDGLLTSASFNYEAFYHFNPNIANHRYQSLVRFHTSGTLNPSINESCIVNLIADTELSTLSLFINDSISNTTTRKLEISNINILDSEPWSISFGRMHSNKLLNTSSSLYLRAFKYNGNKKVESYITASAIADYSDSLFNNISEYNTSGSFIVIGSQSFENTSRFLNSHATGSQTTFSGDISSFNFWSYGKDIDESTVFAKNPESVGVKNPFKNFNHNKISSGSFEKIRIQTFNKQNTTSTDGSGNIEIFDFSQNNNHFTGTGFEYSTLVFKNIITFSEILDSNFDVNSSNQKVRVRSIQDINLLDENKYASTAPIYETLPSLEVFDDTRFSIDMSLSKGLNENLMNIFSDFSYIEDALGRPNNQFSTEYFDLKDLRGVYFNELLEKINLETYRNLFKWLDNSFTDLVFANIPKSTNFLGINFVYDSHFLERHKIKYNYDEIYLKSLPRDPSRGNIFLSQFVCKVKKV